MFMLFLGLKMTPEFLDDIEKQVDEIVAKLNCKTREEALEKLRAKDLE